MPAYAFHYALCSLLNEQGILHIQTYFSTRLVCEQDWDINTNFLPFSVPKTFF